MNVEKAFIHFFIKSVMAREKIFRFKQFSVRNDKSAMKVGTDGVLLGAWADVAGAMRVLDIGTGTGLIALMVAQRCNADIVAIEIDEDAATEANENFTSSPWSSRMVVVKDDFVNFSEKSNEQFDVIISNPPYFIDSLLCPDEKRGKARHSNSLSYKDLISGASRLLADSGTVFLITPSDVEAFIEKILENENLFVNEKVYVCPTVDSMPKRLMWRISKGVSECASSNLVIEKERHVYTDDYIALTHDYYLNMP